MDAIATDGLTRRFGGVVAIEDLSVTVAGGEIFGFLGPNGAGKSTTINVLLGFLSPSSGSATILGHDVTTDSRAVRKRIGLLPRGTTSTTTSPGASTSPRPSRRRVPTTTPT